MKTDLYTKVVLTVIAIALTILVVQNFLPATVTPVHAGIAPVPTPAQQVKNGVVDVNIVQLNGLRLSTRYIDAEDEEGNNVRCAYFPVSIEYQGYDPGIPVFLTN